MWIGFDFFASGKCRDGVGIGGVKQGGSFTIGGIRQAQAILLLRFNGWWQPESRKPL